MAVRPEVGAGGPPATLGELADAARLHEPIALPPEGDRAWLMDALGRMVLTRATEEWIGDMVSQGHVRCPCHLAIGQEAPAVAVALAVRPGDRVFGAHRSHAHYLALGGSVRRLLAEVQGKATGSSGGMGGSMHLVDPEHGLYGTVPIVGATIPIAVGAALAAQMDRRGAMAVAFFGDGATDEGVFHESMNLAAARRLPVLFACENNLFSSHLHIDLRQPANVTCRFAEAHRMPWALVDGNDVVASVDVVRRATEAIRTGSGPYFVEFVTYRWRGHVGPREDEDVGVKRKDDLAGWKQRDPIRRMADAMLDAGLLTEDRLEATWQKARSEVEEAWRAVLADPYPPAEALLRAVYSRPR